MIEVVSTYSVEILILTTLAIGCVIAFNSDAVKSHTVSGIAHNAAMKNAALAADTKTPQVSFFVRMLPASIQSLVQKWIEKAKFGLDAAMLKKNSKSMNHWMVMLGKKALGLNIKAGESEIDSYCDIREHLGETWPYMWEVDNVRSRDAVSVQGQECKIFSSYGYLDLLRNDEVQEAAIAAARRYASGNHGPRMLGGNTKILRELEQKFANWLGREDSLLCSAGYLACLSAGVALCRKGQVVLADDRCHASLRAGLKLCGAKVIFFKHNDFADAEKKAKAFLKKPISPDAERNRGWVMIESVYSMDGDVGDLPAAAKLARKWGLRIMCDEAHGLGVLGKTGRGLEEHFGLPLGSEVDVVVGTFSKSFSSVGGFIVTDARTVKFLDFYAPGNVFSAPLSAYHAGAVLKALEIIKSNPELVIKVQHNSKELRRLLETAQWPSEFSHDLKFELEGDSSTCVLPIVFPNDPIRMMSIADKMRRKGFQLAAVCAPACPVRRPRFRLTATTAYSQEDMEEFVKVLVETTVETPCMVPDILQ